MNEKLYKKLGVSGGINIAIGIIELVVGIVLGVISIVNGAKLLRAKGSIIF